MFISLFQSPTVNLPTQTVYLATNMAAFNLNNDPDVLNNCLIEQSKFEECVGELVVSIPDTIPSGAQLFKSLELIMFEKVPQYIFYDDIKHIDMMNHNLVGLHLLRLVYYMLETRLSSEVFGILIDIMSEITRKIFQNEN